MRVTMLKMVSIQSERESVHRVYGKHCSSHFYSSSFFQTCFIVFATFFSILKHPNKSFFNVYKLYLNFLLHTLFTLIIKIILFFSFLTFKFFVYIRHGSWFKSGLHQWFSDTNLFGSVRHHVYCPVGDGVHRPWQEMLLRSLEYLWSNQYVFFRLLLFFYDAGRNNVKSWTNNVQCRLYRCSVFLRIGRMDIDRQHDFVGLRGVQTFTGIETYVVVAGYI